MMNKLHFLADHDHRAPNGDVTAFKAGMRVEVEPDVAEAALAAGRAEPDTEAAGGNGE